MPGTFPTTSQKPYGSVLQNYIDVAPEWANVAALQFGADTTGVTDATTAIHAARDAGKGVVYFPPGTYKVGSPTANVANQRWVIAAGATIAADGTGHGITVAANGVTIEGPGKINTGAASVNAGVFVNAGLSDVDILGVEIFNGAYGVRCKSGTGAVTTRLHVDNCTIHGTSSHGIFFNWETTDSTISNNQIYSPTGNGIWVGNSSYRCAILGNHIVSSGRNGIEAIVSAGATVIGNTVETCTSIGISLDTCDGSRVIGNRVASSGTYGLECVASSMCNYTSNVVVTPGTHGISISAPSGTMSDSSFVGNSIDHPGNEGITANNAQRLRIIGNEVIEPGNGSGSHAGIGGVASTGIDSWVIESNLIRFTTNPTGSTGINVGGPNHLIHGNLIVFDSGIATSGGTAISLTATCLDNKVTENYVVGNGKCLNGITINTSCTTVLVAGNKTVGTTSNAIQNSSSSTTNVVTGNMCQVTSGAVITMGGAMGANRATSLTLIDYTGPSRFSGNLGFYGTTPIAQQTRAGQLTVAAGTPSTTTTVDVGTTFSQTILNNQIATLATKLNALETIVHNLGLST